MSKRIKSLEFKKNLCPLSYSLRCGNHTGVLHERYCRRMQESELIITLSQLHVLTLKTGEPSYAPDNDPM